MTVLISQLYQSNLLPVGGGDPLVGYVRVSGNVPNLNVDGTTNDPPSGADPTTRIPIRVSGTRKLGITARHLVLVRLDGTSPNQFRVYRRVIVFTQDLFVTAISAENPTIDFEGIDTWSLAGARAESYRFVNAI